MTDYEAKAREIVNFFRDPDGDDYAINFIATALREVHAAGMNMAASLAEPYMPSPGRGQYLAEILEFTDGK